MTTAVDKSPAYARLSAVASAGDLPTAPTPRPGTRPHNPNDAAFSSPTAIAEALPSALDFLTQTDFGLVEDMKSSLRLLQQAWTIPRGLQEYRENTTSALDAEETVENVLNIAECNTVDIALYHTARRMFYNRVAAQSPSWPVPYDLKLDVWHPNQNMLTPINHIAGRQGFHPFEDSRFAWVMMNVIPQIRFLPTPAMCKSRSTMKLRIYTISPLYKVEDIVVLINDVSVDFVIAERDHQWCTLIVGPLVFTAGIQRLSMKLPYTVPVHILEPGTQDQRSLGIALSSIGFWDREDKGT